MSPTIGCDHDPILFPAAKAPGSGFRNGHRMEKRLNNADIVTMDDLWRSQPKHLWALWGNVNGERMW